MDENCIDKRSWQAFKDAGLLWWVNRFLHVFGWVIIFDVNDKGEVLEVFPARCNFKGFTSDVEQEQFTKFSKYLEKNHQNLFSDNSNLTKG